MPTFTDVQRDQIRTYMGMPLLFRHANAILENAMSAIENAPDSGATFNAVAATLVLLQAVDTKIDQNSALGLATEVMDEVKYDAARNDLILRRIGRGYIKRLSIHLSMDVATDYYSPANVTDIPDIKMHFSE